MVEDGQAVGTVKQEVDAVKTHVTAIDAISKMEVGEEDTRIYWPPTGIWHANCRTGDGLYKAGSDIFGTRESARSA